MALSRLAESIPVYGGTGTRLEYALLRASTPLLLVTDFLMRPFRVLERNVSSQTDASEPKADHGRWPAWDRQVDAALSWLASGRSLSPG